VLDQGPRGADPHGPGVVRRGGRHPEELTPFREPGTGDNAPARAVPVLDQCVLRRQHERIHTPHRPHVVARRAGYAEEGGVSGGSGDDAPARPVEMLGERLKRPTPGPDQADRPDIVVSDYRGRVERRIAYKRTGHDMEARHAVAIGLSVRYDTSTEQYHQHKRANRFEQGAD